MSVLVAISARDNSKLMAKLKEKLPGVLIEQWPQCSDVNQVEFVLAWNAPIEMWQQLPNLKVVSSFGAGVDSIDFSLLKADVQVVRIVDNQLADDMAEYVLAHVLAHKLRMKQYFYKQLKQSWQPKRALQYKHVGLLGYGALAQACAKKLSANGFKVSAWANTQRHDEQVQLYFSQAGLNEMLPQVDYLVCLLPLTECTKGVINADLLAQLPAHAVVINVARGGHIIEADLINALNNKDIAAATLDVFTVEPLDDSHPFWRHPNITITPHCAALSDINSVVSQVAKNITRLAQSSALINQVDRTKGY